MFPIDFCHIPVSIIKRSAGRSAVAAAAYRSGTKLTNEWDGMIHDYTRKGGIVHAEIMLPAHAPPEFADRSILWNSVEQIEKARDSQLAREIEAALPRELSGEQQLALVRAYVKDNFVDKGMCADFAIHDKVQTVLSSGTAWSKSRRQGTASLPARLKQPCPVNCPANSSLPLCVPM